MDTTIGLIADYAHALAFDDLPAETVHHGRRCVVDTIGCALGGFGAEPSRIARDLAHRAEAKPGARVIGTSHRALPELAAFANGVMARYLDGNDTFPGGGGHPSNTLAAILATADAAGADGRTVITAVALAYEVYFSLYRGARLFDKGIDHAFYTSVAGAAGAARVMGLDRNRTAEAISLAVTPNVALAATRYGHLSMWKGCAEANGARNAVFAVLLAAAGMTGPDKPLDGARGLKELTGAFDLPPFAANGRPFRIGEILLKRFLSVVHGQPLITVALPLSREVDVESIEKVIMHTYKFAKEVTGSEREKWRPATREAADHSLPYMLAAVLIDRDFSDATFSEQRLRDPRIRDLIDRIDIVEDVELTRKFPECMPCRIEIRMKNGERKVAETEYPRGHWRNPMTDAEVGDKFTELARRTLPRERVGAALDVLWRLDTAPNLDALFEAVRIGG